MKKVLVIYYTQSGQLKEIIDNVTKPLLDNSIDLTFFKIEMEKPFPFPWTSKSFFNAFPKTFLQIPQKIKPIPNEILNQDYDLIILAYQVWYLTPSIPINSLLKNEEAKQLFNGKKVLTLSGSRNMWARAQEKIHAILSDYKAEIVGNIALTDRNINHVSVLTILHWMFTGEKTRYLGFFPKPGVQQDDIDTSVKFGDIILPYIQKSDYQNMQKELTKAGAVNINHFLIFTDVRANKLFSLWANWIYGNPKRPFLLRLFSIYLWIGIWVLMPIAFLLYALTYPLFFLKRKKELNYYQSI
ncbi:MAG: dialkylresorcinol condensing enzyme DarA [Chitinophagales bacterium]|nr:dialkylresorcinol condensing enzyme DarA [Chitinophagales bacterium]